MKYIRIFFNALWNCEEHFYLWLLESRRNKK